MGPGVVARDTFQSVWTIKQSTIANNTQTEETAASGVDATESDIQGDATRNWWGDASGPRDTDCAGNVDCGNWLTSPPDGSTSGNETGTLTVTLSPAELRVTETTAITATVTDASGTPVGGATVEIPDLGLSETTNASGEATLSVDAPAGDYIVSVSADGFINTTETLTVEETNDSGNSDDPVAQYATDNGIVDATGLLEAAADFRSGEIEATVLLDVASAFRSGQPVS